MSGDTAGLGELSVADPTVKGFLSRVSAAMSGQVRRLGEGLVAAVAAIGSHTAMGPPVGLQGTRSGISVIV